MSVDDIQNSFVSADINCATLEQLEKTVTSNMARKIIEFKDKYGSFDNFDQLKFIDRLGERKRRDLEQFFTLEQPYILRPLCFFRPIDKGICSQLVESKFKSLAQNRKKQQKLLLHLNINGLDSNFENLQFFIDGCFPDIICVTEPNKPRKNLENFQLNGYDLFITYPQSMKGGAAIYAKQELKCTRLEHIEFRPCNFSCEHDGCIQSPYGGFENVWIEFIRKRDKRSIVIGAIYKHPTSDIHHNECFIKKLQSVINGIEKEGKIVYILGDFNLNLMKLSQKTKKFCEMLENCKCKLLITEPTTSSKTLVDHIYTNDEILEENMSGVVRSILLDHYPIFCLA